MSKHFVINESKTPLSKEEITTIAISKERILKDAYEKNRKVTKDRMNTNCELKHTENRIVIVIDLNYKNRHTFSDGTEIYLGRQFNNLDRKHTEPVNAWVVSGEGLKKGAEILIHPNAICDTNKISGYESISNEQDNSVRYYSIETVSAFLWRMGTGEWQPIKGFATAFRVFKPYEGTFEGILPIKMKNILYIRSGEFKGKVCHTLKAADYEIIFMSENGQEQRTLRCRHFENEYNDREELIAVDYGLTNKVNDGSLLIGLSPSDCKKLIK